MEPRHELSATTLKSLRAAGLDPAEVLACVDRALDEDLTEAGDVTSIATIPSEQRAMLDFVVRQSGTLAGMPIAAAVFERLAGDQVDVRVLASDGGRVSSSRPVLRLVGPTQVLLTGERTALNFLGHLSGIATQTAAWVKALEGTQAKVRDTRKTTPGLRALQKYAVRCGGGVNHRMSLSDEALIKDNHVAAAGGVEAALSAVHQRYPDLPIEVEVDNLTQLREALEFGAKLILLDNFSVPDLTAAVQLADGRAQLEASGGLSLEVATQVAATGVDFLAVGALTHSASVLDIGADFVEVSGDAARG